MAEKSSFFEHLRSLFDRQNIASTKKGRLSGPLSSFYLGGLVPVLLLVCYGTVIIWSASRTIADVSFPRHLLGIIMGFAVAIAIWRSDYRVMQSSSIVLFVIIVGLIVLPNVPGFGISAKGMTGWVKIPLVGLRFQPSEIVKVLTIFLMAGLGAEYNGKIDTLQDYFKICGVLAAIFAILIIQDLGTGLIVFVVGASIIIMSGAKKSWVLITIGLVVAVAALVVGLSLADNVPHALKLLKAYQLKRLLVFVDPSVDPAGDGYNLLQAKIAVGSGGLFGKGIGNASQAWSGFLPEAHTDFVFALLAEEFGFMGATLLLALFGWAIFSTIWLARRFESPYAKLLLAGVATMWTFQLLQNVGMCIGIMPITGIPLPFISFGSSSMVVQLSAAGIIQSIWHHRPKAA
ncbi:FtsW/RodA/SpoVE family cell cycle protein [Olegusella massiliensis]|uniref:FtsW/RodA/SpoVE family cell cycle protein n=1 Tax=Olegusella massiliensis TaxID=1776381 RepID=UPI000838F879|nr:FtsW/RodA/SpoVE family cell cycle protein [Olegusella massiliensis]